MCRLRKQANKLRMRKVRKSKLHQGKIQLPKTQLQGKIQLPKTLLRGRTQLPKTQQLETVSNTVDSLNR